MGVFRFGGNSGSTPPGGPVFPGTPMHPSDSPPPGPRLGRWGRRGTRWLVLAAALFGGVALCCAGSVAMVVISFPGGYTSPHEVAPSDPEVAPEPTPGPGTPVRDGHLTFVVDRADCEVDRLERGREVRTTDGQFCLVHLTVINADERSVVFRDTDQRAVSSDGAEYGVDSAASGLVARGTALRSVRVDPGDRVAGVMVFHLPAGAHLSRLRLHESSESRGVEVAVR